MTDPVLHCTRCTYDAETPGISFDEKGVCNYCHDWDELDEKYKKNGEIRLQNIVNVHIKHSAYRRKSPYDVVIGVSGGSDSSYMLHIAKEMGLRPLAVHLDNGWNAEVGVKNLQRMLNGLNISSVIGKGDRAEYNDIVRSFVKARLPDIEAPADCGLAAFLYQIADRFNIKWIWEGHSFRTEGISPLGHLYFDMKYVDSVHQKYGMVGRRTYPEFWLKSQLKWYAKGIKKMRPLYYLDYNKEDAKAILHEEYGWQYYDGYHAENKMTAYYHHIFMPQVYGVDQTNNAIAAQVRAGHMSREDGLDLNDKNKRTIWSEIDPFPQIIEEVNEAMGFDVVEWYKRQDLKDHPTYKDFKTYKPTFERYAFFFRGLIKLGMMPESFVKYTRK